MEKSPPQLNANQQQREARRAAVLRENLRKRKAQQTARSEGSQNEKDAE
jgi:hypothetical protein